MTSAVSRRTFLAGAGATGVGASIGLAPGIASAGSSTAATIIKNAKVFVGDRKNTIDTGIAVGKDGRILATGRSSDMYAYQGKNTQVVNAQGGTVMAGLQDGHCHPMYAGLGSLNPSLDDAEITVPDLQAYLTSLLEASVDQEPDGWLQVQYWNPVGLLPQGTVADKKYLDSLDTARPILLSGSDGHNSWVNSRALHIAGVDKNTPDPTGGKIVRDGTGEPTGLLKDTAQGLVSRFIPDPTWEETLDSFQWAFDQLAAGGVTSVLDAWVEPWQLGAYAELAASGRFSQRIRPALLVSRERVSDSAGAVDWARRKAAKFAGIPNITMGTIKVFMDGVIEYPSQTAALLEPYLKDGVPSDYYGELYVKSRAMGRLATAFDAAGWQVHAHAIGDAAVRAALDGYETALRRNGARDNRHTIAHLQLVHPDDYARFAELSVIPDMQLQWASRNVWTMAALRPYIGQERHKRMYPAKSLIDAGARMAGGSDWPVDPLYPWNQVQTAIDRIGLYGEGRPLHRAQGISRLQSLRMHTSGTAFQLHQERTTGTLKQGKQADLVLLDKDVTTCDVSEIKDALPQLTMVGGKVVYDASSTAGRSTRRRAELAAKAAEVGGAGRLSHAALAKGLSRHSGCPCTTGAKH
jgi:predicted amidohydrolase YtcJ